MASNAPPDHQLPEVLVAAAEVDTTTNQIAFVQAPGDKMTFENLEIASPTGCVMLSERHVELALGERVLIKGQPGSGKTIFFQAIAGLWPWGAGRISLPDAERTDLCAPAPLCAAGNGACCAPLSEDRDRVQRR